ncbi:MAG: hypothetical protein PUP90_16310 [Nostoc sp. S4]|nr:hypothetical protein [Nostoc sp. S4]
MGGKGGVGSVGGWRRNLSPHTPLSAHTPHTQKASYIRALRLTSVPFVCRGLLRLP